MKTPKEKLVELAARHRRNAEDLKADIITDIWMVLQEQPDGAMEIMEQKDCPAIVTMVIDDQESECIHELMIRGNSVIALAGVYEDDVEYNLEDFDIPMLVEIFDSVVKHME